jgi:2-dehydropantoate 2-reductase
MLNNPEGLKEMIDSVGRERVLGGFPGAGGAMRLGTIRYLMISQQSTVLGEPDGRKTPRLREIEGTFKDAGFPVEITGNIDAWLKTHAIFITCIEAAIHLAGGDNRRLSESPGALSEMVDGIREGFRALQALKIPIVPSKLKFMFMWMPKRYPVGYWRRELLGELGEYSRQPTRTPPSRRWWN